MSIKGFNLRHKRHFIFNLLVVPLFSCYVQKGTKRILFHTKAIVLSLKTFVWIFRMELQRHSLVSQCLKSRLYHRMAQNDDSGLNSQL